MSDQQPPVSPSGTTPAGAGPDGLAPPYGQQHEPGSPLPGAVPPPAAYPAYQTYPPAYGQQPPPSPFTGVPPTHPQAMTAMILGIVGIASVVLTPFLFVTILGVVCSPFAIWLGARARREIKAEPGRYSGDGFALAGFVTGIVGLVLGVLFVVAVVLVAVLFVGLIGSMG